MSIRQHDFTIERRFRQTPAQAFRAFADPELKQRWFGVPEGWTDANWELDFRVGGSEVSVGRDPRGALHEFRSRYHESSTVSGSSSPTTSCSTGGSSPCR
jgi:uncharacterized protein YndB with AHSA1/START domain